MYVRFTREGEEHDEVLIRVDEALKKRSVQEAIRECGEKLPVRLYTAQDCCSEYFAGWRLCPMPKDLLYIYLCFFFNSGTLG